MDMFCNVRIYLHVMVYVIICFTLAVICYNYKYYSICRIKILYNFSLIEVVVL